MRRSLGLLLTCAVAASGCSPDNADRNAITAANGAVPVAEFSAVPLRAAGAICPIDKVNGQPVRISTLPELKVGQVVTFSGWSTVADATAATPPVVAVVLRDEDIPTNTVVLPGRRVPRNDPSSTEPMNRDSGFSATGRLPPTPGRYRVLVWTGTRDFRVECDTRSVLQLF